MSADKKRWPWKQAFYEVAGVIRAELFSACTRIEIVGSVRRRKPEVGDVEILYVPRVELRPDPGSLLGERVAVNLAEERIADMERRGLLARRRNVSGWESYGAKNKLMVYAPTGMPVDLFAATEENWWNYLVCRTGGAENNVTIAAAAKRIGWQWNPYGPGFSRGAEVHRVASERDVFEFVGLRFRAPEERR